MFKFPVGTQILLSNETSISLPHPSLKDCVATVEKVQYLAHVNSEVLYVRVEGWLFFIYEVDAPNV